MKFKLCSKCDGKIKPNWNYCRFCGSQIERVQTQEPRKDENLSREMKDYSIDRELYFRILSNRSERQTIKQSKKEAQRRNK